MAIYVGHDKRGKEKRAFNIISNLAACNYFKKSTDKNLPDNSLISPSKNGFSLRYVLKKGTMVLLYENNPDEIRECTKEGLVKRLYKVTGLSSMVVNGNEYGRIVMLYSQEARPSKDLKTVKGAYKQNEMLRSSIEMSHIQFKALVAGLDFEINDLGEIKWLR